MFKTLIQKLKDNPRTIVFTEGTDARILEASSRLLAGTFLKPILVGNEAEVRAAAEEAGYNINGADIIDPKNYDRMDEMVAQMVELRKGKMTEEQCREALSHVNYFGTMLVKWALLTAYLVVLHILQLIPFVRLFSLSKQNQATRSYHPASSSFVRLLQATTKYWQWVTAQSTSNRLRMIW